MRGSYERRSRRRTGQILEFLDMSRTCHRKAKFSNLWGEKSRFIHTRDGDDAELYSLYTVTKDKDLKQHRPSTVMGITMTPFTSMKGAHEICPQNWLLGLFDRVTEP